jgi:hypothetical protein
MAVLLRRGGWIGVQMVEPGAFRFLGAPETAAGAAISAPSPGCDYSIRNGGERFKFEECGVR